jgi:poly(3-hydroxybutyrate) depolymerase
MFARVRRLLGRLVVLAGLPATAAHAAHSVTLPAWVCAHPDAIFVGGFESGEIAVPHDPSNGSGGTYPGSVSRTLHIAGLGTGTQTVYLYLPPNYTPLHSWPLLLVLHGVAPWSSRDSYAIAVRDDWSAVAAGAGVLVAAPVADEQVDVNGTPGATWLVPPTNGPNDYDLFAALLADVASAYNVERTRLYGWGFSAGGHVMHDLGVNTYSAAFNAGTLAAYSVSAGDLAGLACQGLSDAQCSGLLAALPRKIPVDIHIGTSDPNYPYAQSDHSRFLAQGWIDGQTIYYNTFAGGHTYSVSDLQLAWTHLCPAAVVP